MNTTICCLGNFAGMISLFIILIVGILTVFNIKEKNMITGSFATLPSQNSMYCFVPYIFAGLIVIILVYVCKRKQV